MKKIKSLVSVLIASLALVAVVSCSDKNDGDGGDSIEKKEFVGDIAVNVSGSEFPPLEDKTISIKMDKDKKVMSIDATVDISSFFGQEEGFFVIPVKVDNLPYVEKTEEGESVNVVDWEGEYTIMVDTAPTTLEKAWIEVGDDWMEAELFIQAGEDLLNVEVSIDIEALLVK